MEYAAKFLEMDVFIFSDQPAAAGATAGGSSSGSLPNSGDGKWVRARVGSYRLGAGYDERGGDPKKFDKGTDRHYFNDLTGSVRGQKDIYTRIKRIDGVFESSGYDYSDISYSLVAPFYGKGYPEEVQLVLQMRYRYQKTNLALADFVQSSFIGLDCNGFVGGYLDRRNAQDKWLRKSASKTSEPIQTLLGTQYFTSWDNFRPPGPTCLILGLCDKYGNVKDHTPDGGVGHIVITEPCTMMKLSPTGPIEVQAVESTGGIGLTSGIYRIETMHLDARRRAFFHVDRGHGKGKEYFRITELLT
jgi:hypothetical protein